MLSSLEAEWDSGKAEQTKETLASCQPVDDVGDGQDCKKRPWHQAFEIDVQSPKCGGDAFRSTPLSGEYQPSDPPIHSFRPQSLKQYPVLIPFVQIFYHCLCALRASKLIMVSASDVLYYLIHFDELRSIIQW